VRSTLGAVAVCAARTLGIERAHLACDLAALVPLRYALVVRAHGFSAVLTLANAITNR
jgi:hypothetical protein